MAELPANLARNFAAAAVSPALRSVLLVDLPPRQLRPVAAALAEALSAAEGRPVAILSLATAQDEDDLWGGLALSREPAGPPVTWQAGILTRELETTATIPLVIIPDLAHVGVLGQRACVSLLEAPEAHLERHGQSRRWRPRICWLAACAARDLPQVSPHLLDRFALRIDAGALRGPDRAAELRALADAEQEEAPPLRMPAATLSQIDGAMGRPLPRPEPDLAEAVRSLLPDEAGGGSPRRALAQARLIAALARLDGKPLGVLLRELPRGQGPGATSAQPSRDQPAPPAPEPGAGPGQAGALAEPAGSGAEQAGAEAGAPGAVAGYAPLAEGAAAVPGELPGGDEQRLAALDMRLYPEDGPRRQAADPLRLPPRRFRSSASASGPIIGVEQADTTEDLALVATIVEAAKWQRLRRVADEPPATRLRLRPADLRRNRRAPVVEQLLLLVVDHTCRAGFNWVDALLPQILWAYQERASVVLVQVGAAGAAHQLQAALLSAPSVLVPQLNDALNAGPGYSTPLAHGLDLALKSLRRLVHGGRSAVRRARLVVLSDGRGNVPLGASRAGVVVAPVGRQGFEDALEVARQLAALANVQRLLIAPEPRLYPELARRLAAALDAPLSAMAPLEAEVAL